MINDRRYQVLTETLRARAAALDPGQAFGTELGFVKEFGVSRTTVRRAVEELVKQGILARRAGVGIEVARRISGADQRNLLILIKFTPEEDEIFTRLTMGVVETANQWGYRYHILNEADDAERMSKLDRLDLGAFSGAVMTAFDCDADRETLAMLESRGIPVVLVDNPLDGGVFSYVVADDYAGGYKLGRYLGELGHRRTLFLRNVHYAATVENRRKGLRDGLKACGAELLDSDERWQWPAEREVMDYVKRLLAGPERGFSAIACSNDILAHYVIKACSAVGVSVPDGLSVTGFGDYRVAALIEPSITTVRTSGYRMGAEAVTLLTNHDLLAETKKIILSVELAVRKSTGPARL